jgi:hypothetical protein
MQFISPDTAKIEVERKLKRAQPLGLCPSDFVGCDAQENSLTIREAMT